MFERAHHKAVAQTLAALNKNLFLEAECFFGGGTSIVLLLGEYRESVDIDFLCASETGYRRLRELTFGGRFEPLLAPDARIDLLRDVRTDQYGIRTWIGVGETRIKFEIVRESRVSLSGALDARLGVPVLSRGDLYAEKLLANADRYADKAVLNRDIIDLGLMISRWGPVPGQAWQKARAAYGTAVDEAYKKAVASIRDPGWLETCMQGMAMDRSLAREILESFGEGYPPG
ncbi:MAG: nucleotidyl transferase AbiEii/AbiGii toxin family protein [Pseudomonadota bacterium]|nr:nucleotidyl transferase AbiEii/AbiGii toxin family protein [Pseudomonadota bacterium]